MTGRRSGPSPASDGDPPAPGGRVLPLTARDVDAEVAEELRFHLEMRAREFELRGIAPHAARRAALARFGDYDRIAQVLRAHDRRRLHYFHQKTAMTEVGSDMRYALRGLRRAPGFALAAVLTLALGIGGTTAVFSVVYAALLRPLPYPAAERLVDVTESTGGRPGTVSPPNFADWQQLNRSFAAMAAWAAGSAALSGDGAPEQVEAVAVTPELFRVLGVAPAAGRPFTAAEAAPGGPKVVILGDGLWRRRFGGTRGVVGRSVRIDGENRTVVGVMPPGFDFPAHVDLWTPLGFSPDELATQRGAHYLRVVARIRAGRSLQAAAAEMTTIGRRLAAMYPNSNPRHGTLVRTLRDARVGDVRPALLVLLGAVGLVLLLACANVANLLLARGRRRGRERVVRVALGATGARLARMALVESLVLALAGGTAGLAVAAVGMRALASTLRATRPELAVARLDGAVLLAALGTSVAAGLVFGVLPAIASARLREVAAALRGAQPVGRGQRRSPGVRGALVLTQVAAATLLLTGAALLARSFAELRRVDVGFRPAGVWTFSLALPDAQYPPARAAQFYDALLTRVRARPQVRAAGATMGLPLGGLRYGITVRDVDGVLVAPRDEPSTQLRVVTDGYLSAVGMRLVRGRPIVAADRAGSPPVAVVNETLARRLWPGQDPLGHRFTLGTRLGLGGDRVTGTVVGLVADVRDDAVQTPPEAQAFFAHAQYPVGTMTVAVRADRPSALARATAADVAALDPQLPVFEARPLDSVVSDAVAEPRLYLALFLAFAGTALALAAVGVHGVVALAVGTRTREIGVRMALGARAADVVWLVLRQAMAPAGVGVTAGIVAAWGASRVLRRLLYGVSETDPMVFLAVPLFLLVTTAVAAYLPSRRAAHVPPTTALRADG